MSSPLPLRPSIDHTPRSRTVIDLATDESAVFEALASETARSILDALDDDPAAASDLADRVDTSLQNVQYHLENLREAGLVVEAGQWYSSKGKEMRVYAVATRRLELCIAPQSHEEPPAIARDEEPATVRDDQESPSLRHDRSPRSVDASPL